MEDAVRGALGKRRQAWPGRKSKEVLMRWRFGNKRRKGENRGREYEKG